METNELFLASDAALRSVIDRITAEDFDKPVPAEWTAIPYPTIRDILKSHAYDEAWIPGILAGASVADGDDLRDRDLLGDDPIAAYDALHDAATAAVRAGVDPESTFHFQYGDYPAKEGFAHLAMYRAFQAWMIAASWMGMGAGLLPRRMRGGLELVTLAGYAAVSGFLYGQLMNLSFWPFTLGPGTALSFLAGAPVVDNLHRFIFFSVATSLGWDLIRAVVLALGIALVGRPVLSALRRTARIASFRESRTPECTAASSRHPHRPADQ